MRRKAPHCRIKPLNQQTIGVYSDRGLTSTLREKCPDFSFADAGAERDGCRIAVFETSPSVDELPRKSLVRIILGTSDSPRRPGELRVDRDAFVANPRE